MEFTVDRAVIRQPRWSHELAVDYFGLVGAIWRPHGRGLPRLHCGQSLIEVRDDVFHVLDAH